jgi:hypothetical protein
MTPGAGCSITSTTTVSISRLGDGWRLFRVTFLTARWSLAVVAVRFVPPLRADFNTLRALPREAELLLRNFARFFRLAMIDLLPL